VRAVRFQFPYQEAKRRAPDRVPVLEETWRAAITHFAGGRTIASGRSMGGRIASQVVAEGVQVAGLALFAYPLHPPGKPEQRRIEHLPALHSPVLFCSGTRDAFASPSELRAAAALLPNATVHLLENADHGFSVPMASSKTREDIYQEAVSALQDWIETLG
jgi:predicted alpha/beta-hydrolase family hydrolase